MKRKRIWIVAAMLLLLVLLTTAALAVGGEDPLISLSYLTGVFKQQLLGEARTQIEMQVAGAEAAISQQLQAIDMADGQQNGSGFSGYVKYTLSAGEYLYFSVGSEILLLSGSATVETGSLTDSTAGLVLGFGGSLTANHLCIGLTEGSLCADGPLEIMICE